MTFKKWLSQEVGRVLLEASLVFSFIAGGLLLEFFFRFGQGAADYLTKDTIFLLVSRAFLSAAVFTIAFRLTKWGLINSVSVFFSKNQSDSKEKKYSLSDSLLNIFVTTAGVLVIMPVRPILQKVYLDTESVFSHALVKYDAFHTFLILSLLGIPLIFLIIRKKEAAWWIKVSSIILAIAFSTYANYQANYDARIYETRASWITKDFQEQELSAKKALSDAETDQERAVAYYWLGVAANREGRYEQAIEHQLKAVELDPSYGPPYSSLSSAYLKLGELEKCKSYAEKCIKISPRYAWCYYFLSGYYYEKGNIELAWRNIQKATELDPNNEDIRQTYNQLEQVIDYSNQINSSSR